MNLPNRLTLARVLIIPFFMVAILTYEKYPWGYFVWGEETLSYNEAVALFLFLIAALTDQLDGYLARKMGLITNFGKLMDPLADKMLVTAALVMLVQLGRIPAWMVILILSREFAVSGLRMIAASEGMVMAAGPWGKLKTVLQMIAISLLIVHNLPFSFLHLPLDQIMLWAALMVTLISGFDYFWKNPHIWRGES
ncbi:CDP-diacylglycerol-glycerol-3-phosphate 3-phosphatidyltransferase [[Clostridium] ultunense Esp]|uniref:CDP-diacylglycerol--glycerol-3-phosphate 3-phosphatidyltransferase n=1 Tax=Thermicanus aegyptius TaxID=94009 RepID=UPI0002B7012F|nr:CDP-diacylglycerol--glycerol-3-phosphate 3-phosphatidyltransferase [Thermicanus aegyptius]CCQ98556.1 CDP-diacylglycerol-glycerol-3-phosphate 3-phosphatidyltransferase [[Clostridium] ultunense Esp]